MELNDPHPSVKKLLLTAFATLGVVYGDIGTSVLYAVKECFHPTFGLPFTHANVLGIMSLIFWSIILIVVVKYLSVVMNADNKGEGGILSLLALVISELGYQHIPRRKTQILIYLGIIGAALLVADGTITPAISVLSAMEGLKVATPALEAFIEPVTILILIGLFLAQKNGTHRIAKIFAPAMLIWFVTLIVLAIPAIASHPKILLALNPAHAIHLLTTQGKQGFFVLGAVVLCVTGAEALYADMGHFGKKPIRWAWYILVLPSLVLNYFGQGALILEKGAEVLENPFYALAPSWAIYPLVTLATIATVIASQALISGSFSLAQQAIQLGFAPRMTIIHTSEQTKGQIYVPEVNYLLMISCVLLVVTFKSSSNLASAYGISVMGTMLMTTILIFFVMRKRWRFKRWRALAFLALFLAVDIPFLIANLPKIASGGWFPLVICVIVFTCMATWKRGRRALLRRMSEQFKPTLEFVEKIKLENPYRVDGVAVFMTGNIKMTPPALLHHYQHNKVLHKRILILSIVTAEVPTVPLKEVVEIREAGCGLYEVVAKFGFMQSPKVEKIFRILKLQFDMDINPSEITYFLGRDVILTDGPEKMSRWRKGLFVFLARNSLPATAYFGIPNNRVVELGMQVKL